MRILDTKPYSYDYNNGTNTQNQNNKGNEILTYCMIGIAFVVIVAVIVWRICAYKEFDRRNAEELNNIFANHLENIDNERLRHIERGSSNEINSRNEASSEESQRPLTREELKKNLKFLIKKNFKIKKFKKKYTKYNTNCSICLEDFSSKEDIVALSKCNHLFHYKCIIRWILKSVSRNDAHCPNCNNLLIDRELLTTRDLIPQNRIITTGNLQNDNQTNGVMETDRRFNSADERIIPFRVNTIATGNSSVNQEELNERNEEILNAEILNIQRMNTNLENIEERKEENIEEHKEDDQIEEIKENEPIEERKEEEEPIEENKQNEPNEEVKEDQGSESDS